MLRDGVGNDWGCCHLCIDCVMRYRCPDCYTLAREHCDEKSMKCQAILKCRKFQTDLSKISRTTQQLGRRRRQCGKKRVHLSRMSLGLSRQQKWKTSLWRQSTLFTSSWFDTIIPICILLISWIHYHITILINIKTLSKDFISSEHEISFVRYALHRNNSTCNDYILNIVFCTTRSNYKCWSIIDIGHWMNERSMKQLKRWCNWNGIWSNNITWTDFNKHGSSIHHQQQKSEYCFHCAIKFWVVWNPITWERHL